MLDQLTEILRTALHRDPGEVTELTTLEELAINSLELIEVIMAIEERFDITIEVDAMEARGSVRTVGDLITLGRKYGLGAQ